MGKKFDNRYFKIGLTITVSLMICIIFAIGASEWRGLLKGLDNIISAFTPVIIGFVLAFLLNPIMMYIRNGLTALVCKIKKIDKSDKEANKAVYDKTNVPALVITIIVFLGAMSGFFSVVIPHVFASIKQLIEDVPGYWEAAKKQLEWLCNNIHIIKLDSATIIDFVQEKVEQLVADKVTPNIDTIVLSVSSGVVGGVKAIFNFFVGLLFSCFFLAMKQKFIAIGKKIIYCIFNKRVGNKIMAGLVYANKVFGGYISGKIIDSIIMGILCFIFTSAMGMTYAVLISVIVGVTNFIPFFGPFFGAFPGALLAMMDRPIYLIVFLIFILCLQQFDGNILGPLILGDSIGLSSVWVLIAIIVGGDLFGLTGMVIGVPVFACIYALCKVLIRDGLRKKKLPPETDKYVLLKSFDEDTGEPYYDDEVEARHTVNQQEKKRQKKSSKKRANKKSANEDDTDENK